MGTFSGLNTALTSLYAQRRALDVAGQNIANANTEGYSRQRIDMSAAGAPTSPAFWSQYRGVGSGVVVNGIDRMRDVFVDARLQLSAGTLENTSARRSGLTRIEQLFGEPTGNGLQSVLSDVWSGFDDVANNPTDLSARQQVLQRVQTAIGWLNEADAQFSSQYGASFDQLKTVIDEANTVAQGIATLNGTVLNARLSNIPVNELEDQRDKLAMRLAELVGSEARRDENGSLNVFLGGSTMVSGTMMQKLAVEGPAVLSQWVGPPAVAPTSPAANMVSVTWAKDGMPLSRVQGSAAGLLSSVNEDLPTYSKGLDAVVANFVGSLNAVHASGYGMTDNTTRNLFDPTKLTAGTIELSASMLDLSGTPDASRIAASGTPPVWDTGTSTWTPNRDGSIADAMAKIGDAGGGPVPIYRKLVVDLGVQAQSADRTLSTQKAVKADAASLWQSVSGVNLDEEMTNMLQFQRAYEASSRVISAVDQMLDKLINGTGMVGR